MCCSASVEALTTGDNLNAGKTTQPHLYEPTLQSLKSTVAGAACSGEPAKGECDGPEADLRASWG